jgi:hypothetical protein
MHYMYSKKSSPRLLGAAALAGALAASSIQAASLPSTAPASLPATAGPNLQLSASRYFAIAPARVTVYGRLNGVPVDDSRYCHPGETWITGMIQSGAPLNTISKHDPRCLHPPDELRISRTFAKDYRFSTPGSYICRLVISTNDGRIVQSNPITIVVR